MLPRTTEIETMEWGRTEWFDLDPTHTTRLTMGINVVHPYTKSSLHTHFGNEQVIYILSGSGAQRINDEWLPCQPKDLFYLPSEAQHQTDNPNAEPLVSLIVSLPSQLRLPVMKESSKAKNTRDALWDAIHAMHLEELAQIEFPLMVFDDRKRILYNNKKFPVECREHCDPWDHLKDCPCMQIEASNRDACYTCPWEFRIFDFPIPIDNADAALLKGGFLPTHAKAMQMGSIAEGTLKSTSQGAQDFLAQIRDGIVELLRFYSMHADIREQRKELLDSAAKVENLSDSLKSEKQRSTLLKINHHFLFNVLNHFASLSLTGERQDLYDGILDLATMLRFAGRLESPLSTLAQELEYVDIYLRLQKRRYGDLLHIEKHVDPDLLPCTVPFNLLQPIVENAFTHGFMEYDGPKFIRIDGTRENGRIEIRLRNNGLTVSEHVRSLLNRTMREPGHHGMQLIYQQLLETFEHDFVFGFVESEEGATVAIQIPERCV